MRRISKEVPNCVPLDPGLEKSEDDPCWEGYVMLGMKPKNANRGKQMQRNFRDNKRARFHEGPEGQKEFEAWKAEQPKEFQEEWDANTEEYGDQFKQASLSISDYRRMLTAKPVVEQNASRRRASNNYRDELLGEDASPMSADEMIIHYLITPVKNLGKYTPLKRSFNFTKGDTIWYGRGATHEGIPNTAIESVNLLLKGDKLQVTLGLEYGDSVSNTFNVDMRKILAGKEDHKVTSNILKFLQEYYTYDPDGYLDDEDEDVPTFYTDEEPSRRYSSRLKLPPYDGSKFDWSSSKFRSKSKEEYLFGDDEEEYRKTKKRREQKEIEDAPNVGRSRKEARLRRRG